MISHSTPESFSGGPIAVVKNGGLITIDAVSWKSAPTLVSPSFSKAVPALAEASNAMDFP